jgi:FkbM family methyltransferase
MNRLVSWLLRRYYRGPDHPFKVRIWSWIRRRQNYRRFLVRYGPAGWLTLDERCFLQRRIFDCGAYEPEVAEALLKFAVSGEVVWDIGANIGSFAVAALQDSRVQELHCFEPDPDNRATLTLNLALNPGARQRVWPLALSDRTEQRTLHQGPTSNRGLSCLGDDRDFGMGCLAVNCTTLDELVLTQHLNPPTLIKMDVEGWEYSVLLGATKVLQQAPPKAIVFESTCDQQGQIANQRLPELLKHYGYGLVKLSRREQKVDAQENFLAVRATDATLKDHSCASADRAEIVCATAQAGQPRR